MPIMRTANRFSSYVGVYVGSVRSGLTCAAHVSNLAISASIAARASFEEGQAFRHCFVYGGIQALAVFSHASLF